MWFLNDNTGYILCDGGAVFRTTDGSNFQPAGNTCFNTVFDLYCINDSTCFASGSFTNASCDVSFTTNRGESWTNITFPYAYAGWGVHARDTSNIWLVGQNQTIIRRGIGDVITSAQDASDFGPTEPRLYPNPSDGIMQISSAIPFASWLLTDLSGRVIQQGNGDKIDLSAHASGLYLVTIKTGDGRISSHKIIRE
jgi:hypothetical protein